MGWGLQLALGSAQGSLLEGEEVERGGGRGRAAMMVAETLYREVPRGWPRWQRPRTPPRLQH